MRRKCATLLLTAMLPFPAVALDCSNLTPTPPQNTDLSYTGKLDAAIEGAFAKLATAKGTAEGNYTKVATSVLQQFKTGDTTYMWERVLFLQCQLLGEAKDIPTSEKLNMLGQLYGKFGNPPPPIPASTVSTNSGNTPTYSGNTNSGAISGNGSVSNSGNNSTNINSGNTNSNTFTNSGANTNAVQGNGNSVSIGNGK
jgi:hypothetical protein